MLNLGTMFSMVDDAPYWMAVDYQIPGLPFSLSGAYVTGNKRFTILQQCRLRITLSSSSGSTGAVFKVNSTEKWRQNAPGTRTDYWDATAGQVIDLNINSGDSSSTATVDADIVAHWSNVSDSACHSAVT